MKIVICEDEKIFAKKLAAIIHEWAKERGISVKVFAYSSAERFWPEWQESEDYDALFLDIVMGEKSGMELAGDIRRTNADIPIVFVTNMREYAIDGYEVSATQYILKTAEKEKYYDCLDRISQNRRLIRYYVFKDIDRNVRVPHEDIIYIEKFAHKAEMVTPKGRYEFRRTMVQLLKELDDDLFARCHKSYIINIRHLDSISNTSAIMANGDKIPLSKNMSKEMNERFYKYNVNKVR